MGLGNNRDYKTNDRRVRHNLTVHAKIMDALVISGMSRETASEKAYKSLVAKDELYKTAILCLEAERLARTGKRCAHESVGEDGVCKNCGEVGL